jgi:hypothetical protein
MRGPWARPKAAPLQLAFRYAIAFFRVPSTGGEPLWIVLTKPRAVSFGAGVATNCVKLAAPANYPAQCLFHRLVRNSIQRPSHKPRVEPLAGAACLT